MSSLIEEAEKSTEEAEKNTEKEENIEKEENDKCPVCFETTNNFMYYPCAHFVCYNCLCELIQHKHHQCPLCRKTVSGKETTSEYESSEYESSEYESSEDEQERLEREQERRERLERLERLERERVTYSLEQERQRRLERLEREREERERLEIQEDAEERRLREEEEIRIDDYYEEQIQRQRRLRENRERILKEKREERDRRQADPQYQLLKASEYGEKEHVNELIDAGVVIDLNTCIDNYDITPLYQAIKYNQTEIAKRLIESGADNNVNFCTRFGKTILYTACHDGNVDNVKMLLEAGAQIKSQSQIRNSWSNIPYTLVKHYNVCPLRLVMGSRDDVRDKDITLILLEKIHTLPNSDYDISLDVDPEHKYNILHEACNFDDLQIVKLVVEILKNNNEYTSQINMVDRYNEYPIHKACKNKNIDIVQYLLDSGDINIKTMDGRQLLLCACSDLSNDFNEARRTRTANKKTELVKLLLEAGLDTNMCDKLGNTYIFEKNMNSDILRLVLNAGADINKRNRYNELPIHYGFRHWDINTLQILLDAGATIPTEMIDCYNYSDNLSPNLKLLIRYAILNQGYECSSRSKDFVKKAYEHVKDEINREKDDNN